jgi:RNA polymerase sigma factor (sigma-70 family)
MGVSPNRTGSTYDRPLTVRQLKLVKDYAAQWPDPAAVAYRLFPGLVETARRVGMTRDDIQSAGWRGVMRAAYDYDPTLGAAFPTYAVQWIRGSIATAARSTDRSKAAHYGNVIFEGDSPTGRTEYRQSTLWDVIDPAYLPDDSPEEFNRLDAIRSAVRDALRTLSPKHREILTTRWGLDGSDPKTLCEVGAVLGVCRERVRQIEHEVFSRIAVPLMLRCGHLIGGFVNGVHKGRNRVK